MTRFLLLFPALLLVACSSTFVGQNKAVDYDVACSRLAIRDVDTNAFLVDAASRITLKEHKKRCGEKNDGRTNPGAVLQDVDLKVQPGDGAEVSKLDESWVMTPKKPGDLRLQAVQADGVERDYLPAHARRCGGLQWLSPSVFHHTNSFENVTGPVPASTVFRVERGGTVRTKVIPLADDGFAGIGRIEIAAEAADHPDAIEVSVVPPGEDPFDPPIVYVKTLVSAGPVNVKVTSPLCGSALLHLDIVEPKPPKP